MLIATAIASADPPGLVAAMPKGATDACSILPAAQQVSFQQTLEAAGQVEAFVPALAAGVFAATVPTAPSHAPPDVAPADPAEVKGIPILSDVVETTPSDLTPGAAESPAKADEDQCCTQRHARHESSTRPDIAEAEGGGSVGVPWARRRSHASKATAYQVHEVQVAPGTLTQAVPLCTVAAPSPEKAQGVAPEFSARRIRTVPLRPLEGTQQPPAQEASLAQIDANESGTIIPLASPSLVTAPDSTAANIAPACQNTGERPAMKLHKDAPPAGFNLQGQATHTVLPAAVFRTSLLHGETRTDFARRVDEALQEVVEYPPTSVEIGTAVKQLQVSWSDPVAGEISLRAEMKDGLVHASVAAAHMKAPVAATDLHRFLTESKVSVHKLEVETAFGNQSGRTFLTSSTAEGAFSGTPQQGRGKRQQQRQEPLWAGPPDVQEGDYPHVSNSPQQASSLADRRLSIHI